VIRPGYVHSALSGGRARFRGGERETIHGDKTRRDGRAEANTRLPCDGSPLSTSAGSLTLQSSGPCRSDSPSCSRPEPCSHSGPCRSLRARSRRSRVDAPGALAAAIPGLRCCSHRQTVARQGFQRQAPQSNVCETFHMISLDSLVELRYTREAGLVTRAPRSLFIVGSGCNHPIRNRPTEPGLGGLIVELTSKRRFAAHRAAAKGRRDSVR